MVGKGLVETRRVPRRRYMELHSICRFCSNRYNSVSFFFFFRSFLIAFFQTFLFFVERMKQMHSM